MEDAMQIQPRRRHNNKLERTENKESFIIEEGGKVEVVAMQIQPGGPMINWRGEKKEGLYWRGRDGNKWK